MNNQNPQELANTYEQLNNRRSKSQNQINELQGRLLATQNAVQPQSSNFTAITLKIRKHDSFTGKPLH